MTQNPLANPMLDWWQQQWTQGVDPMARTHLAWM